ncbi:hypothetical protein [Levilactobacillus brevis]|uniref:hypothetical protein n=1 Tax=Levilactobacillus brevis TaxID=1580 RepID=UPI0031D4A881
MAGNTLFGIGKNDDSTGGITITARVTGSTRQGFLTLWALFFLAGISLLVILVVSGQAARRESTTRLITEYNQAARRLKQQTTKHVKKVPGHTAVKPLK